MYRLKSADVCLVVDLCPSPYDIDRSRVLAPTVVKRSDPKHAIRVADISLGNHIVL